MDNRESKPPLLVIFSGRPGCGKTTISQALSTHLQAVHIRIDTIEQALRDAGVVVVEHGYRVGYAVARDNLSLGLDVVADSVNPIEVTRSAWQDVAITAGCPFVDVQVICSDPSEHRSRVEGRRATVDGLRLPTWSAVQDRHFEPWSTPPLVLDTAGRDPQTSMEELLGMLHTRMRPHPFKSLPDPMA